MNAFEERAYESVRPLSLFERFITARLLFDDPDITLYEPVHSQHTKPINTILCMYLLYNGTHSKTLYISLLKEIVMKSV